MLWRNVYGPYWRWKMFPYVLVVKQPTIFIIQCNRFFLSEVYIRQTFLTSVKVETIVSHPLSFTVTVLIYTTSAVSNIIVSSRVEIVEETMNKFWKRQMLKVCHQSSKRLTFPFVWYTSNILDRPLSKSFISLTFCSKEKTTNLHSSQALVTKLSGVTMTSPEKCFVPTFDSFNK